MTTSPEEKQPSAATPAEGKSTERAKSQPGDLQPEATGANRGSPAAPVMKQFQKTQSESTGRS